MAARTLTTMERLGRVLAHLEDKHPTMSLPILRFFSMVVAHEGERTGFFMERLGHTKFSTSRFLSIMTSRGFKEIEGLGLVEVREDPLDARHRVLFLTSTGKGLADKIAATLEG